jgi:release factor glutamine methyltransferase
VRDHEPRAALVAELDGLAVLRALVAAAPRVLVPGGWLVVEMGAGQAPAVAALVARNGRYGSPETVRDPAGITRVLAVQSRAEGPDEERRRGSWTRS